MGLDRYRIITHNWGQPALKGSIYWKFMESLTTGTHLNIKQKPMTVQPASRLHYRRSLCAEFQALSELCDRLDAAQKDYR